MKGVAMKILDFFQNELNICNENKARIEDEIHRAKIDIDFLKIAEEKIKSETDTTYNIFYANNNQENFENQEITKLLNNIKLLEDLVYKKNDELNSINSRIAEIDEALEDYSKKISNESNVDNHNIEILKIQEAERQRIARDIHDTVVQRLTVLLHKSEFSLKVIDSDPIRTKLELEVINRIIKQCIDELREIILDLRPMSLDDLGLEVTLKRIIDQISASSNININFEFKCNNKINFNSVISISALRIIQELCSNAIKYSKGNEINIDILTDDKYLYIYFEDNGIGYDGFYDEELSCKSNSGLGIPILKDRVKLLNGNINVGKNKNSVGTRYEIEIPIHDEVK